MYTYKYPRPALTVDSIVFVKENVSDNRTVKNHEIFVLLIQRGKEPYKDKWALPGGFVEMDELLEDACRRELEEETGVKVDKMIQFRAYDEVDRDPRHRTISVIFTAELSKRAEAKSGDDAAQAKWFPLTKLPELAFDHAKILADFAKQLL